MKKRLFLLFFLILTDVALSADNTDVTIYPDVPDGYTTVKVGGKFRLLYSDSVDTLKIVANSYVIKHIHYAATDDTLVVNYAEGKGVGAVLGGRSPIVYVPARLKVNHFILSGTTHMECLAPIVDESVSFVVNGASRLIGEIKSSYVSVHCKGSANVTLTGISDRVDIRIDGVSRVAMGEGFECNEGSLDVNGAGVIRINCKGKLSGKLDGTSVVKYSGNPELKIEKNGLSSISVMD